MPILHRRCPVDGRVFDLLFLNGEMTALDDDNIDQLGCPECHTTGEIIVGSFLPKDLGGEAGVGKMYPYDDKALGCRVRDAAHHRWLLTHEPNGSLRDEPLVQTHGEFNFEDICDEAGRRTEKSEKAYRAQQEELVHGPNREAYGKLCEVLRDRREIDRLFGE